MIAAIVKSAAFAAIKRYWVYGVAGLAIGAVGALVWRNHSLAHKLDRERTQHLAQRAALLSEIQALEMAQQFLANSLVSAQERIAADEARERDVFEPIEREVANGEDAPMAGVMLDGLASLRNARADNPD